jgi:hypothetical protein
MDQDRDENRPSQLFNKPDFGLLLSKTSLLFPTTDVDLKREEEYKFWRYEKKWHVILVHLVSNVGVKG